MWEKKPVMLSDGDTYPVPPTQPSCRQKMKRPIRPSQNTGVEMPTRAKPIAVLSTSDLRFTAERTPIATPEKSQRMAAPAIRKRVRGARWKSRVLTEDSVPPAYVVPSPG